MTDLTNIFNGPWEPPPKKRTDPPEVQLRNAMLDAGLTPPERFIFDGKIHRFRSGTKGSPGHGDKPGWYLVFSDGIPAGRFGCWRAGVEVTWHADMGRELTTTESMLYAKRLAEAKELREAELARQHEAVSESVDIIWSNANLASPDHPYLARKGIKGHGARVTGDGRLVVPIYDKGGDLTSLQYITGDGKKLYHSGGKTGGCFWMIGTMDEPGTLYIAEGFATAATIYEETGRPCAVAYSASGLVPTTEAMREIYGEGQDLIIVADNDESGTGQKYADQASAKYGAKVIMPPIPKMDANDYKQAGNNLSELLIQQTGSAIIEKLKVVFGDQLGDEYEAPDELVEGIMTIGSTVVVYGDSNSGKTFWALSVATAIANGTECYGRRTDKGLVVYLATESPSSIRSRMQAIKKYYQCSLENIAMVPVPMNFYTGDGDAHDVIEMVREIERIKGTPVRLIIGDTLSRMSAGANENSGEDMGPVMARFERVASATGAAMMIIHHNGKDAAKGARGWSGIRAHIDTEIEVSEKDDIRSVNITKQRELPGKGETIYFKLEIVEMGISKFGNPATTCVAIPDDDSWSIKPDKKVSKYADSMRLMERAWWVSGAETRNNSPYISRSVLRDLMVQDGITERTARNKTDQSRDDSMVSILAKASLIYPYENGWIVLDDVFVSANCLLKNGAKNY